MFKRREFLAVAAAASLSGAETKPKLLFPTDEPDPLGFKIMWYNPIAPLDHTAFKLQIKGLVDKPKLLTLAQLRALPQETQSARLKCVQCWSSRTTWGGFRFGPLIEVAKPRKTAHAIRLDCADGWYEYFTFEQLQSTRVLFTLDMAGKPLSDQHGAPLRMLDPARYGYKSAKLITSITFVEEGRGSMACDFGPYYSPDGKILPGYDTPQDQPGRTKRKINGGEITDY